MEELAILLEKAVAPFLYPFSPGQRIYFLYLVTALALAFIAYNATTARRGRSSLTSFLRACFPKQVYGHRSAWVDYKFFVVNRIAYPLLFAPLIVGTAAAADWTGDLLVHVWGPSDGVFAGGGGASIVMTLLIVLATDAGVFIAHYLQHKVPALWEFHKVHHSA
jgi:sterol desaturase/sphingolipid hydroxylase (fatty acid hydroxylase superfamily)